MPREAFGLQAVLDGDSAFEAILTDIPLFSVGLMAMGFITFIFTMNRANPAALYLCTASLLLFIAAILDLGRLLTSGPTKVIQNVDSSVASAFVVAREVGLGLSYGFLFLFIWMAVAQRSKLERRACVQAQGSTRDAHRSRIHSASWKRWGLVGLVLKWLTLLLAILISLLQILWRIVTAQRRYGSLYIAESTLEIVASTIFLLKIVLNILISSGRWWAAFRPYIALVLALVITAGMGAGNLLTFAFSESILGRFIRAISIYILLLYSLVHTFDKPIAPPVTTDDCETGLATVKHGIAKDQIVGTAVDQKPPSATRPENTQPSLRVSASSRFSALVSHAEKREALAELTRTITSKSTRRLPIAPITSPKKPRRSDLHFDIITPALPSATEAPNTPGEAPTTGVSLTYYTMNFSPSTTPTTLTVPRLTDHTITSPSPAGVQDNDELIPQTSFVNQPPVHLKPSITSFDELMRQQNELDKSIANLRLLSIDTRNIRPPETVPTLETSPLGRDTVASAKSTLRTDSLSQHSEFSLSVFPLPPPPESVLGDKRSSIPKFLLRKLPQSPVRPPSQVQLSPSIRNSSFQNNVSVRLTSAGTQYDVTSFIDDLAEPASMETAETLPPSALDVGAADLTHNSEPIGELGSVLRSPAQNLKPMFLPSVASERMNVSTHNMRLSRNGAHSPSQYAPRDSSVILKPFLLGTAASTIPVSLRSSTMVALGPHRAGRLGRVATHKSQISGPMINLSNSTEETPGAYERPRRPPLHGSPDPSSKT